MDLAKQLLKQTDWVVLDTETTGLGYKAEAVSIGVLSSDGQVLLGTLVKPTRSIPFDARRVHGITDEMVQTAPTFKEILPDLLKVTANKKIVVYNADYDRRIVEQSFKPYTKFAIENRVVFFNDMAHMMKPENWIDVMGPYAEFWGEWNDWHQNYRWQKLTAACQQQGVTIANAHRAIGDCQMTLALIRKLGA